MNLPYRHTTEPVFPSNEEMLIARDSSRKLASIMQSEENFSVKVEDKEGQIIDLKLPSTIIRLLLTTLEEIANGNAITIMPVHGELTTNQAAEILNVSRPFLIKLLDEGKIAHTKVGSHRRIKVQDIIAYKQESYIRKSKALDELTEQAQDLNWDYE